MAHRVTLIPGDGIGPEVTAAACRVLEATGVELEWDVQEAGTGAMQRYGDPLRPQVLDSIARNRVALKGPITTVLGGGVRSVNIQLRRALDLFAQVRPCRSYPGAGALHDDVDLVVMRETTEDLYAGIEFGQGTPECADLIEWIGARTGETLDPGSGISIKPISEAASRRVFEFAFDFVRRTRRRKVTAVHKAVVMAATDGLFLRTGREVAERNPDVEFGDIAVDLLAADLVRRPRGYDVLVTTNLYGDILSDLAAALIGGVGLAPGANFGATAALFEPAHGSAPRHAGKNRANPMAMILSGAMMLRHLGEVESADRVEQAVAQVVAAGDRVTYDLKPSRSDPTAASTSEVADAVIEAMREASRGS